MANAFFTALPGAEALSAPAAGASAGSINPASAPTAVSVPADPTSGAVTPGVTPPGGALPAGSLETAAPPTAAVRGGGIPGPAVPTSAFPSSFATAPVAPSEAELPRATPTPGASIPASPFYFLEYAGSGWDSRTAEAANTLNNLAALTAQPAALPSPFDLSALRVPSQLPAGSPGMAAGGLPTPGGLPSFYFAEPTLSDPGARELSGLSQHPPFNVASIRRDFPILAERVNGRPLVWLDNAATTQKPQAVIDRLVHFYSHENSNIHRAAHELAARATDAYEGARATVQRFLGASSPEEIVFVRGATEAINLVAQSWGRQNILPGDEIVISHLEHHANIVPWQMLASEKGARLRIIPVDDSGQILLEEYQKLLNSRTRIVSIAHVSNALGTIVPVREVAELAHRAGARVLIDGAQSVSHMPVDVRALGADFYVFSGHKVFGPTGIGVLYGTAEVLESMQPWQGGGNMISAVTLERASYQKPPARFEAGTGNIADAAGLAAALDYISRLGMANIDRYEHDLLAYATAALQTVPGLRLIGTAREKASVLSFVIDGYDPVAVGSALNEEGIAVRAGHHCAEPILHRFGVKATVRPSLAFYNTCEEVDALAAALHRLVANSGLQ